MKNLFKISYQIFIEEDINCNQHAFVNGKWTSYNILESIDIVNEYLIEGGMDLKECLIREIFWN